jgi:hypothetical protein
MDDAARRHARRVLIGRCGALDQQTRNTERALALLDAEIEAERAQRRIALGERLADLQRRRREAAAELAAMAS